MAIHMGRDGQGTLRRARLQSAAAWVGIDPGLTNCTATALYSDNSYHAQTFNTSGYEGIARLSRIQELLEDFLTDYKPVHICLEAPITGGVKYGVVPMAEAGAGIRLLLWEVFGNTPGLGVPTMVSTSQLKKFVLSKGTGPKNQMLLGVYKQWGESFRNDNEADSYALAQVAKAVATNEVKYDYQRQVIDRLTTPQDRRHGKHSSRRKQRETARPHQ
jgi:Holliday junction resolvasome RuvABC endonuclease subunit